MFNPKSPLAAAGIFLTGVAVIAFTTLDINRTLRENERPMTPQQMQQLQEMIEHHDQKAAGAAAERCITGEGQRRQRAHCCRVRAEKQPDPFRLLGIDRNASRSEIRGAYYARVRELHPDVNPDGDTTAATVALNLAYAQLLQGVRARSVDSEDEADMQPDVFDRPEAAPSCIFVNPFACSINPLDWRELQEVVVGAEDEEVAADALRAAGLYFAYDSAIAWVTPAQLELLRGELEAMEGDLSYDLTGYYVTDCLLRARFANNRVTYVRTARGVNVE